MRGARTPSRRRNAVGIAHESAAPMAKFTKNFAASGAARNRPLVIYNQVLVLWGATLENIY